MSDATILIVGCAVTFTAIAGAYLAIREGYQRRTPIRSLSTQAPGRFAGRREARPGHRDVA